MPWVCYRLAQDYKNEKKGGWDDGRGDSDEEMVKLKAETKNTFQKTI